MSSYSLRSIVCLVALSFAFASTQSLAEAKKGKKSRKPDAQKKEEDLLAPETSFQDGGVETPSAAPAPSTGASSQSEDPALYNLETKIPLYKKNDEKNFRLDDNDPFVDVAKHTLRLGLNAYMFKYKEESGGSTDEYKGIMPGLVARFDSAPFERRFFFGFLGEVNMFKQKFKGTTFNGTAVDRDSSSLLANLEIWIGMKLFKLTERTDVKAYVGLGYRYWKRGSIQDGVDGFSQIAQWAYAPVGIRIEHATLDNWQLGVDLSVRPGFLGRTTYEFSELNNTLSNTEAVLGSTALAFRLQIPVSFQRLLPFPVTFAPWVEVSGFGEGSPAAIVNRLNGAFVGFVTEPKSSYFQTGVTMTADLFL